METTTAFQPQTFAVVGAGPVGCIVAAFLAKGGYDVTLCDVFPDLLGPALNPGIIIDGAENLGPVPGHAAALAREYELGARSLASVMRKLGIGDPEQMKAEIAAEAPIVDEYPILGRVTREGGRILEIEYPWGQEHVGSARERDVDVAWQWCHDPRAGMEQGALIRIWIGTKSAGPRAQWSRSDRMWRLLRSRGNFGQNWACGGNWSGDRQTYATLEECAPDLAGAIAEIRQQWDGQEVARG